MATTQTTYADAQPIGQPGALANSENWNAKTRSAGGNIGFGLPVVRSGDRTVVLMSSRAVVATGAAGSPAPAGATITVVGTGGGQFEGIAKRDISVVHTTADRYEQYDNITVLDEGVIFGTAGATVTAGEQAYWDEADSRYTNVTTDYFLPGVTFNTSAVDGGIVELRVRVPRAVA